MTKRVRFDQDFDWRPDARHVVAYKAGTECDVLEACAKAAVAAGKAVIVADRATALPKPVVSNRKSR